MKIECRIVKTHSFTIILEDSEAKELVTQYGNHGSPYYPTNHGFCGDGNCVSCKIVETIKEQLQCN